MLQVEDTDVQYERNLGHVIGSPQVVSIIQCQDSCLRNGQCVGFNYHFCMEGLWKKCELLGSLGSKIKNECVAFQAFDYEQVRKVRTFDTNIYHENGLHSYFLTEC